MQAVLILKLLAQQFHGNQNRREGVVEVVRDAGGEPSEAFRALGAQDFRLEIFFLRDVAPDADQPDDVEIRAEHQQG